MDKYTMKIFSIVFLMIMMITLVSSQGLIVPFGTAGVNYSINVNYSTFSDNWNTNLGKLGLVNATEFQNVGSTLTINNTWMFNTVSNDFLEKDGSNVNQDIDLNGYGLSFNQWFSIATSKTHYLKLIADPSLLSSKLEATGPIDIFNFRNGGFNGNVSADRGIFNDTIINNDITIGNSTKYTQANVTEFVRGGVLGLELVI